VAANAIAAERRLARIHARARETGPSPRLYAGVRGAVRPLLRFWFGLSIAGGEYVPAGGPAILAPNHKSFMDAFFLAMATRRPVRYMAKAELFRGPLGFLFPRLGAFPVRRGKGDADALATARTILEQGGLVVLFPEGTRVEDPDALGLPHHGAGRLAVETGAPIVPAAITGTAHLWIGPIAKPRRVRVALRPAIAPPPEATPGAVATLIDEQLWPQVAEAYGGLRALPGAVLAALTALGLGGGLLARRQARAAPRLLGVVEPRRLRRRRARRRLTARLRR
jgi:1-acyl-sn-glycerol-3-phosphate acyltransferase